MSQPPQAVVLQSAGLSWVRRRLGARLGWAALATLYLPFLVNAAVRGVTGAGPPEPLPAIFTATILLVAPLVAVIGFVASRRGPRAPGAVRLERGALHVGAGRAARTIPLGRLAGGAIVPAGGRRSVELELDDGDILSVEVADERAADRLLEAVELDASRRRVRLRAGGTQPRILWAALAVLAAMFATIPWAKGLLPGGAMRGIGVLGLTALCGAAVFGLGSLTAPPEVTVGADGIAVRRWGRSRFVPYEDIERVEHGGLWLAVARRGGGSIRLGSAQGPYAAAIAQRIEAARAAWQASAQAPARMEDLDRGGRSLEAWRGALRRLVINAGYRAAAWSADALQEVLGDARAPAERRLGAAIALREMDAGASPRIRVASETSAQEPLRVALEKLAGGAPDDDVERALEELAEAEADAEEGADARVRRGGAG